MAITSTSRMEHQEGEAGSWRHRWVGKLLRGTWRVFRQLCSMLAFEDNAELSSSSNCFTLRSAALLSLVWACKEAGGASFVYSGG